MAMAACGTDLPTPEDQTVDLGLTQASGGRIALPGTIEAEDYAMGGEGVGYHDTTAGNTGGAFRTGNVDIEATSDVGGGYDVGWVDAREWLAYAVNAGSAGRYTFSARVSSQLAGTKSLHIELDGIALAEASFTDASGWQSFRDLPLGSKVLTAGPHVVKVVFDTDKLNLNAIAVGYSCVPTTCAGEGANCGSISNGCGGTLSCGTCSGGQTCGGSGTPNVCGGGTRFPGDPGVGKIYIGGATDKSTPGPDTARLDRWETKLGGRPLGIQRVFSGDQTPPWDEVDTAISRHTIPHMSFKETDLAGIAAGNKDAWLDTLVRGFKARAPTAIWWTFFHEPEDNFTTAAQATNYRAAVRYIYRYLASHGVTNATHVATAFMNSFTFGAASGRDWRFWHPDYKGTTLGTADNPDIRDFYTGADSVVDLLGLDTYMQGFGYGSPLADYDVDFFDHAMAKVVARMGMLNHKGYVIPEIGFRVKQTGHFTHDTGKPSTSHDWVTGTLYEADTRTMMRNLYTSAIARKVVGIEYWNNGLDLNGWKDNRLDYADPNGVRYDEMKRWIDDPRTVHLP